MDKPQDVVSISLAELSYTANKGVDVMNHLKTLNWSYQLIDPPGAAERSSGAISTGAHVYTH